jgi:serine/threonine protein kinase
MRSSVSSAPQIALPSRYDLLFRLAAGGTAAVHLGRLRGIAGFWRLVAIKVPHAHLGHDPEHREMMIEEASLASKIHHPNVVPVIDMVEVDGRLLLVMDYIEGASLSDLLYAAPAQVPARIALRVALDACAGLQAAHELSDASGQSLGLVHRDVSPHNILVGADGVTRLTDFGIAKTTSMRGRSAVGALKGKLAYMAPEYVTGSPASAGSDVFGLAVVVWELLAGRRLFLGDNGHETLRNVLDAKAPLLSSVARSLGHDMDVVLAAALAKNPAERFCTAKAFGTALETAARRAKLIATAEEVSAFVRERLGEQLAERRRRIASVIASEQAEQDALSSQAPSPAEEVTRREVDVAPASAGPLPDEITAGDEPPTLPSAEMSIVIARSPSLRPSLVCDETPTLPSAEMAPPVVTLAPPTLPSPSPSRRGRWAFTAVAIAAFLIGGLAKAVWLPEASSASSAPPVPALSR